MKKNDVRVSNGVFVGKELNYEDKGYQGWDSCIGISIIIKGMENRAKSETKSMAQQVK